MRFMERGGIYGRSISYPWVAHKTRHVFSTCIHIRFGEHDWSRASANARAYNTQQKVPLFAYQFRALRPWTPPRKTIVPEEYSIEWRAAA